MTKNETLIQDALKELLEIPAFSDKLDFSIDSIKLIDTLIEVFFENGNPVVPGPFEKNTQWQIIRLGAYVGEVIIRNTKDSNWIFPSDENASLINTELRSTNLQMWPLARTIRRIQNGMEDELHPYVDFAVVKINGTI